MYVAVGLAKSFELNSKNTLASAFIDDDVDTEEGYGSNRAVHSPRSNALDHVMKRMRRSPCGNFFATCSASKVFLWSSKAGGRCC